MVDEPENMDDDIEEPEEPVVTYEDLVTEEPENELDLDDYDAPRSVTETEEDAPQTTDIKYIIDKLSPKSKFQRVNDLAQPAMVSRVFPDNLLDKMKLMVYSLIIEHEEEDSELPFADYVFNTQDMVSIGYEGRGIIDRLELAGVAREEEMEKALKDLGL